MIFFFVRCLWYYQFWGMPKRKDLNLENDHPQHSAEGKSRGRAEVMGCDIHAWLLQCSHVASGNVWKLWKKGPTYLFMYTYIYIYIYI